LDSGYYAACSALKTQSNALEIVANNIANVSTVGYRGQMPAFESLMVQTAGGQMNGWERLTNEFAALNGSRLNMAEGNLEPTGNPLDFAIEGPGFFAVNQSRNAVHPQRSLSCLCRRTAGERCG
jgi:flagellar basal-body rod protein FlgF